MVFKNKLFFSSKKSDSSSPDGSSNNSPRSASNSPIRSDKKKSKSKADTQIPNSSSPFSPVACKQTQVKDGPKKKDPKSKVSQSPTPAKSVTSSSLKKPDSKDAAAAPPSLSPILASSLGLNKIKTPSGPLPQESFFGFRGEKGSAASVLGASNLSKAGGSSGAEREFREERKGESEVFSRYCCG